VTVAAVVFDFDGLILETEEPIYVALRELWEDHGLELTVEMWGQSIGTNSADAFDALAELNRRAGTSYTEDGLTPRLRPRIDGLIEEGDVLPGVIDWVTEAEAAGLGVAIASSSSRRWVTGHLARLGHLDRFPVVTCYDDVGVHKPEPDAYLAACRALDVDPAHALAIEDSANGVRAAKAAGLRCVAVPTAMTRHLDFSEADLVVGSLAHITLAEVIAHVHAA
jgi:HAD superfamily hydrolase (TIGR01509 family)